MKQELFDFGSKEYVIKIGQNKQDNYDIIDQSIATDIWFHVDGMPSGHIILKTIEKINSIPYQVIKRCAYLCKINSKAKKLGSCNIIYTTMDNITKTGVVGQVNVSKSKIIKV